MVHSYNHNVPFFPGFDNCPGSAHRIAHITAGNSFQIRVLFEKRFRKFISLFYTIFIICDFYDFHIRIFCNDILHAKRPVLMAWRSLRSHQNSNFTLICQFFTQSLCQRRSIFIVMRIPHIRNSVAPIFFTGIGARKRHNLLSVFH